MESVYSDINMSGITNFTLRKCNIDMVQNRVVADFWFPTLKLTAKYNIHGKVKRKQKINATINIMWTSNFRHFIAYINFLVLLSLVGRIESKCHCLQILLMPLTGNGTIIGNFSKFVWTQYLRNVHSNAHTSLSLFLSRIGLFMLIIYFPYLQFKMPHAHLQVTLMRPFPWSTTSSPKTAIRSTLMWTM